MRPIPFDDSVRFLQKSGGGHAAGERIGLGKRSSGELASRKAVREERTESFGSGEFEDDTEAVIQTEPTIKRRVTMTLGGQ
jgi:hypothetical protein